MLARSNKTQNIYDVIVIGGGASGMMAAGVVGENSKKVLILEKNGELGKKLKITGGGRCNITNNKNVSDILSMYGKASGALQSPFSQFGVSDTFKFFESKGLQLVTEANDRVFPVTQKAYDVYKVLEDFIKENNVEVSLNTSVTSAVKNENEIFKIKTSNGEFEAKNIIISTGGQSHPETGSTGDGFKILQSLGHKIKDPTPGLVPIAIEESWIKELSGTALDDVKFVVLVDGVKKIQKRGRVLITHFGLSGPLIINTSKKIGELLCEGETKIQLDMFPTLDYPDLERLMLEHFDNSKNKDLKNVIKDFAPNGTYNLLISLLEKNILDKKVHSITKNERKSIARAFKNISLTVTGLMGFDKAIIADGGIMLSEIDTKSMQSKIIRRLFVTGDLLDIYRPSGGYSLQLCWTTGFVAGSNIN